MPHSDPVRLAEYKREYYLKHAEERRLYERERRAKRRLDPEAQSEYLKYLREKMLLQRYGITHKRYLEILDKQGGRCAICQGESSGSSRSKHFMVDHDHVTGDVRGLLCVSCNTGLGVLERPESWLSAAKEYLERTPK